MVRLTQPGVALVSLQIFVDNFVHADLHPGNILVQGADGMITQPKGYLRRLRELCDREGALLVCDEVATGFGRTGTTFAVEQEGVVPDILTMAKGITGGYLPLAATVTTELNSSG